MFLPLSSQIRRYFIYLLLSFLPMQGFAAATLPICNMLAKATSAVVEMSKSMPNCDMEMQQTSKKAPAQHDTCKNTCASLCANLSAFTLLTDVDGLNVQALNSEKIQQKRDFYVSITPANLLRPPKHLS